MVTLMLDADEYLAAQALAEMKAALGDPELAELNVTELGADTQAGEILYHAGTLPFLASGRLVVVRGYLGRLDKRMAASGGPESPAYQEAAQLLEGLAQVPQETELVFVDQGLDRRRGLWRGFRVGERTVQGLADRIQAGQIRALDLSPPDVRALPGWIARRARELGLDMDGRAIQMLADFVGVDLRRLENELQKLASYAAGRRIVPEDVRQMVSDAGEALIWDLTDALGRRDGRRAMAALYELRRNDAHPFYLLTMMVRQYRILIKVREALDQGGGNEYDIARRIGERPYPVKKAMQQCRAYRMEELEAILLRLLEADVAMKSGADPDTEIDVLVAELTERQGVLETGRLETLRR